MFHSRRALIRVFVLAGGLLLAASGVAAGEETPAPTSTVKTPEPERTISDPELTGPIPETEFLLAEALNYTKEKIRDLERKLEEQEKLDIEFARQLRDELDSIASIKGIAEGFAKTASDPQCNNEQWMGDARSTALRLRMRLSFSGESGKLADMESALRRIGERVDPKKECAALFAPVRENMPAVLKELEDRRKRIDTEFRDIDAQGKAIRQELRAWKERKTALLASQNKLIEASKGKQGEIARSNVVEKLPWLIFILGVFSLSIIIMVRRFSDQVQRVWVESGQVIQFMTVTILIIVVLSLGLAERLQNEALGTLLGAIGGYVLSQGLKRPSNGSPAPPTTPPSGT